MRVGERPSKNIGRGYENDPMFAFAESYTEVANSILNEGIADIYGDTRGAIMKPRSYEQLKSFFVEQSFDPQMYVNDPEGLEEHTRSEERRVGKECLYPC